MPLARSSLSFTVNEKRKELCVVYRTVGVVCYPVHACLAAKENPLYNLEAVSEERATLECIRVYGPLGMFIRITTIQLQLGII